MVEMERRPTTATLIRPAILDTRLLGIFDMTTVSREHLLAIKNLVQSNPLCECKSTIPKTKTLAMDCESAEMSNGDAKTQKVCRDLNKTYRVSRHNARSKLPNEYICTDEHVSKIPIIPIPCVTCGRQNQPERFHSHPSRREIKTKESGKTTPPKDVEKRKTVQKPVPIKFKSAKIKSNDAGRETSIKDDGKKAVVSHLKLKKPDSPRQIDTVMKQTTNHQQQNGEKTKIKTRWKEVIKKTRRSKPDYAKDDDSPRTPCYESYTLNSWAPAPVSGDRKRRVVCYLCSQEFGTATLPSHEEKCIQTYLKATVKEDQADTENKNKISSSRAKENWKLVLELTQAVSIACKYCGRKFLPNRLEAHQNVCSSTSSKNRSLKSNVRPNQLQGTKGEAYDKWFAVIKHHEDIQKSKLFDHSVKKAPSSTRCINNRSSVKTPLSPEFNALETNQLNKTTDIDEMVSDSEVFWKIHQAKLVPCKKCARTFYPDRLEVHLRGCDGSSRRKPKPIKNTKIKLHKSS